MLIFCLALLILFYLEFSLSFIEISIYHSFSFFRTRLEIDYVTFGAFRIILEMFRLSLVFV
jgi:hypothetical protein